MKCDQEGNVYCTGPGGIHVMDPGGRLLGRLRVPGHCTNFAWGDDDWRSLYYTTYHGVHRTRLNIPGVPVW
jgi:gluconolactonase